MTYVILRNRNDILNHQVTQHHCVTMYNSQSHNLYTRLFAFAHLHAHDSIPTALNL
jgi:hypothetical protein